MKTSISEKTANALELFQKTVSLSRADVDSKDGLHKAGDVELLFKLTSNRGSAPVRLPVDMIPGFVALMEAGPMDVVDTNESILDIVKSTLMYETDEEDGKEYVSFRTGRGKGSKVQRIPRENFKNFVEMLRATTDALPSAIEELKVQERK